MKNVIILVGLPNAGKSTYRNEYLKGYKVISFDDTLEKSIAGNNYNEKYQNYMKLKKLGINFNLKGKFIELVRKGEKNIVIDMVNINWDNNKYSVLNFINIAKDNGYRINTVIFDTDYVDLLKRNTIRSKNTNKYIPLNVLKNMQGGFNKLKGTDYKVIRENSNTVWFI